MATSYKKKKQAIEEKIKPAIEDAILGSLERARRDGLIAGWYAAMSTCASKLTESNGVDKAVEFINKEAERCAKLLSVEQEDNENIE